MGLLSTISDIRSNRGRDVEEVDNVAGRTRAGRRAESTLVVVTAIARVGLALPETKLVLDLVDDAPANSAQRHGHVLLILGDRRCVVLV